MRIAILGPTASGKSTLAVAVARRAGAEVVNGDPFQAYAGLAIGTGQPSEVERGGVGHRLYGALPLSVRLDPVSFGCLVRRELDALPRAVLVTGSGLYLRGIWQQLSELPEVPAPLVDRVRSWAVRLPTPRLHRFLAAADPARAAALHPRDTSRVQRALALHLATGARPSDLLGGVARGLPEGWRGLLVRPSRARLRARVEARVRAMVEAGWRDEVAAILAAGQGEVLRALRPLGYLDWMEGGAPAEVEARIVHATQAYAKRQETFFRNQWPELESWDPDLETPEDACRKLGL